jgi:hypothetical protein
MGLDILGDIGKEIEGGVKGAFKGIESFVDKNLNLSLFDFPDLPTFKKPKKRRDFSQVVRAIQQRILETAKPGRGRQSTIGTSTRGV